MQDRVYQTAIHDVNELKHRLGRHEAERDQQGYWWMALKARGVCSCQGTTFWTSALLNMSITSSLV